MKASQNHIFYGQQPDTIIQKPTISDYADASDEELLELFSKYAQQIFTILENSFSKKNNTGLISQLSDIFYNSFREPLFITDNDLNIQYKNIPDIEKFEFFKKTVNFADILKTEDYKKLQLKISERKNGQIFIDSLINSLPLSIIIIPFEADSNSNSLTLLLFKENEYKQQNTLRVLTDNDCLQKNKELLEIPKLYQKILETINGFYFVIDKSLRFVLLSRSVTEKLGYTVKDLIGKPIENLLSGNENPTLYHQLKNVIRRNRNDFFSPPSVSEIIFIDKKGIKNYYEISFAPYFEDKTKESFLLCTCVDINERKFKTNQLEEEKEKAEQNDQLKSEFLANMSHEIRTPLNGIIGFSALIDREGITPEKRDKYMRIIRSSSRQLLTLINDIIDFSKIEARQLKIVFKSTDINQIIDELYLTFSQDIKRLNKETVILKKIISSNKLFIDTDDIRMQQVLINLLNNALKFTDNGEITFGYSVSENEDSVRFFVRDTGVGIPLAQQKLIFKRFLQTREGEKQKYNGTGLGLAISKGIVELMGGNLKVDSTVNSGSEFYFTLNLTGNRE